MVAGFVIDATLLISCTCACSKILNVSMLSVTRMSIDFPACAFALIVSILVLLEVSFRHQYPFLYFLISIQFQSLFYWKYLSDLTLRLMMLYSSNVSILVLLEVSFRLILIQSILRMVYFQFQSLFYWKYLSDRQHGIQRKIKRAWFQSLFYWKYLSDQPCFCMRLLAVKCFNPCFIGSIFQTCTGEKNPYERSEFQSLFYWKYLSDYKTTKGTNVPFLVSILVLLEVSFRLREATHRAGSLRWFQSLFYWKYLSDTAGSARKVRASAVSILVLLEVSFRPRLHSLRTFSTSQFQSLFYWKYLSDDSDSCRCDADDEVSILVLLEVSFRRATVEVAIAGGDMFQSLFYWKYLSDFYRHILLPLQIQVSILVLLEVSFRLWTVAAVDVLLAGFNPCFIGSIFQTQFEIAMSYYLLLFQSLFYWKYLSDLFRIRRLAPCLRLQFQSLFYWKYLSDHIGGL